jgi:hypothetical protein
MANSGLPKDLADYLPILKDQGIPNVVAAYAKGVGIQYMTLTVASDPETVTFADQGLSDMADANYIVLGINQTDSSDPPSFGTKTTKSFAIAGPDAADVVDILIVGKLKGQLS